MGKTDFSRTVGVNLDFRLTSNHPVTVASVLQTLRNVEAEAAWNPASGTGICFPSLKLLGTDVVLKPDTMIQHGEFTLAWIYGPGETITPAQGNAFEAYLTRIRNRLQQELGAEASGATVIQTTAILFD